MLKGACACHRKMRWLSSAAMAVIATPLPAQETGDAPPPVATLPAAVEGAKSYSAQDFARFAPKNAYDMLNQVPGFIIVQGNSDVRGLGQARTNILINGERFSGKSNDVVTELSRIPANDVVRIDIVDGATLNVPGLSGQVANIVVNAQKKMSGQFQWNPQTRFLRLPPRMTNGQASISGSSGAFDYTLGFKNDSFVNGNAGPEIVTDRDGVIIDRRDERLDVFGEQPKLSAGLKYKGPGGSVGNLNAAYQIYHFDVEEISLRSGFIDPTHPDAAAILQRSGPFNVDRDRRFFEQEREWNYELGGDYEFGLGGGRLKLIGLRRYETSPYYQYVVESFADGRADGGQRYEQKADEAESILRGEYSWKAGVTDWQVAAEGAYNVLDFTSFFGTLGSTGAFNMAPQDNAIVDEKRAEASVSYGRPLSSTLTLQASLGGEYSKISQSGARELTRSFYRPKGFVSLAWKPSPRLDVSAKLERVVGQLNFLDFVSFVNVGSGTDNAGNPELVPQQSWNGQIEATRNLGAYGTVTARIFGRLYQDVIDVIPIGTTGQSVGNLDKAHSYGIYFSSTLNLDPFGVEGAKIDAEAQLHDTSIEDQLTGRIRGLNSLTHRFVNLSFRHDIPRTDWAYGASYNEFENNWYYRLDERNRGFNSPGSVGVFVEHKDVMGLTIKASLDNLLGTQEQYTREVYDTRRTNRFLFREFRDRDYGPILTLSISGEL